MRDRKAPISQSTDTKNNDKNADHSALTRRRLLTAMTLGGSAASVLPGQWSRPVIESVVTPAHAQSSYTLTCVSEPPTGTTVAQDAEINVVVTLTPNPGPGHTIEVLGLCNGSQVFDGTRTTDTTGQINDSGGDLDFCNVSEEACVRYSFGGASVECCWIVGAPSNCLLYGTQVVKSSRSYVAVETLQVGDLIMGLSNTAQPDYTIVTKVVTNHLRKGYYTINSELRITNDHPVLVTRDGGLAWCTVEKLVVGDRIRSTEGVIIVETIENTQSPAKTVYVETSSGNFVVGGPDRHYVVKSTYGDARIRATIPAREFDVVAV